MEQKHHIIENTNKMKFHRHHKRICRRLLGLVSLIAGTVLLIGWLHLGPSVLFHTVYVQNSQHITHFDTDGYLQENQHEKVKILPLERCPIPYLRHEHKNLSVDPSVQCRRLEPLHGSCTLAHKLFFSEPPAVCTTENRHRLCVLKETNPGKYSVSCDPKWCKENGIKLGITNSSTGSVEWKIFSSAEALEEILSDLANGKIRTKTYGFALLSCSSKSSTSEEHEYEEMTYDDVNDLYEDPESPQLLVLPEHEGLTQSEISAEGGKADKININILWIDSVSRHHFFRSLPKTLATIEEINSEPNGNARVLDYKLFQAIKSRTYENMQALISGEIDLHTEPFGIHDMPPEALHLENFFYPLRSQGYRTVWLEDMCWHWEWGLPKDLLSYDSELERTVLWQRYWQALKNAGIDDVGLTVASCQFLRHFNRNDPFYGPDAMCYNGFHQHDYILDYLQMQQKLYRLYSKPYFSMFVTSVAHEPSGRRVQTLDVSLARYLLFAAKQSNTVTVILSDHGNSYGEFMQKTSEGQVELYQPLLFILTPNTILRQLDKHKTHALFTNQNRLISMFDLHQTIKSLVGIDVSSKKSFVNNPESKNYDILPTGILQVVSANRNCSSLPLLRPNLCICQDYEQPVKNNSYYALFADYGLGQLNNEIQRQYKVSEPSADSGFGNCKRLVATSFRNVRVTYESSEMFTVKLNLIIPNPERDTQDVFVVVVQSSKHGMNQITLLSFERVSTYGVYRPCADKGVDIRLCVCSLKKVGKRDTTPLSIASLESPVLQLHTMVTRVDEKEETPCLYMLTRETDVGVSFEAANVCPHKTFTFEFKLFTKNAMSSVKAWPVTVYLSPWSVVHLCTEVMSSNSESPDLRYTVTYS